MVTQENRHQTGKDFVKHAVATARLNLTNRKKHVFWDGVYWSVKHFSYRLKHAFFTRQYYKSLNHIDRLPHLNNFILNIIFTLIIVNSYFIIKLNSIFQF